ncbi:MAG: hypothetical protein IJ430_07905 [Parabacteroides sp.]|nr:hypothetical protein [Parabacteroides sp.]
MKEKQKNIIQQMVVGIVSTLFVIGLFYYALFHGVIHDWAMKIWQMIKIIIN